MQRIGHVIHLSSDCNLILKAEKTPRINDKVVDEKLDPVGFVFDIIGSTNSPYVAVRPEVSNPQRFVTRILYSLPHEGKWGRRRHE